MGMFGKFGKSKKQTDGYVQPTEALPVATLVSEYTSMPEPTAPLNPAGDNGNVVVAQGGCCDTPAACSTNPQCRTNAFAHDETISRFPMTITNCPHCNSDSRTRVRTAPTWKTWVAGGGMCFLFWPLAWAPLVVDSCKKTEHFCVECGAKVAEIDAFEDCCVEHRG